MYAKLSALVLFLLLYIPDSLFSQRVQSTANTRFLSNLEFFYNEINDYYVNLPMKEKLYGFSWNDLYFKYRKEMIQAKTEGEFYRIMSSYASELNDINCVVNYKGRVSRINIFKFSEGLYNAFNCRLIEDKVLIVNSSTKPDVAGKYIISINNVPIEEILDKLSEIYKLRRTKSGAKKEIVNRKRFIEYFQLFRESFPDTLEYKLEDYYTGEISTLKIAKNANFMAPRPTDKPHVYLGFHYNEILPQSEVLPNNIGYIRLPSFDANKNAVVQGFSIEVNKMLEKKVNGVILDLRWASGNNETLEHLLPFFTTNSYTPFYFRFKNSFRFNDLLKQRQLYEDQRYSRNSRKAEEGYTDWWQIEVYPALNKYLTEVPVVILTNELTSGEASLLAFEAAKRENVIIVGENFALEGHGLATPILFPDRMYYTRYSFRETVDSNFTTLENRVIKPDILSKQTISDYKKGIDSQIDAAKNYLLNKK